MRILVVIDVQNDFVTGSLANKEAEKRIPNIVNKIKNFEGDLIIVTRDTHHSDYLNSNEGHALPVKHCIKGTWGWELVREVDDAMQLSNSIVFVDKPTFGSFELIDYIKAVSNGEHLEIEIVGFVSSICVVSNALLLKAAFYDNASITVDKACVAGLSNVDNEAAFEVMKCCQIGFEDSSD